MPNPSHHQINKSQFADDAGARGKFVSGAKVLAAVPSISQRRRVYEDILEELSTNNEIQSFGRVVFWNGE